jgi:transcriptional regulator with XRE-family HTH domain
MPSPLAVAFGKLTRQKRLEAEWSQEELAEKCNLHRTYIGSIERAEKTVTIDTAYKIAQAFEITLDSFFKEIENKLFEKR